MGCSNKSLEEKNMEYLRKLRFHPIEIRLVPIAPISKAFGTRCEVEERLQPLRFCWSWMFLFTLRKIENHQLFNIILMEIIPCIDSYEIDKKVQANVFSIEISYIPSRIIHQPHNRYLHHILTIPNPSISLSTAKFPKLSHPQPKPSRSQSSLPAPSFLHLPAPQPPTTGAILNP